MPQLFEIKTFTNYRKYQWLSCGRCGKERWVRLVRGKSRNLFCQACTAKPRDLRQKRICVMCGNGFKAKLPAIKRNEALYCSNKCRGIGEGKNRLGGNHPNWKGDDILVTCRNCGKSYYVRPYLVNNGLGNFCSTNCQMIFQRKQGYFGKRPNKPEQIIIDLFTEHNIPFKYVGDGDVWLGNHNPDFINTNGKKQVIEFLGTYWHPLFDGANRKEHYKQYGFNCLVIWEDELANKSKILIKVKGFLKSNQKGGGNNDLPIQIQYSNPKRQNTKANGRRLPMRTFRVCLVESQRQLESRNQAV